jgi:thiol-disulfide isomerase/thioredoxin
MFTISKVLVSFLQKTTNLFQGLILLAALGSACQSPSKETQLTEMSTESEVQKTPPTISFESLDGAEVAFAPTENQWTVLHFWATWCKPCLAEFPELKKALPKLDTDKVQFILASDEDLERIDAFQKKHQTGLELIRMKEGSLADFEIYALPTTIILDKEGKEVYRHAGQLKWAEVSSIDQLVTEKP